MTVEINAPWSVVETECGEHVFVTDAHGNQVVRLPKRSLALATFIAAAPDLLEALQEFLRNPGGDYTEDIAENAIAKATGGKA